MREIYWYRKELFFLISLLLTGFSSLAQHANFETTHEERATRQTEQISKELDLTETQKKQLFTIVLNRSIQTMESRDAGQMEGISKAQDEYQEKLYNILTADQIRRYKEIEAERHLPPPH